MSEDSKGYSREEEYFYKVNKERIQKKREELDKIRSLNQSSRRAEDFWMRCPKCGGKMETMEMAKIFVDKCTSCSGIYFDKGELEVVLESQSSEGFLAGLKGFFRN